MSRQDRRLVVNTSPLIHLAEAGLLHLLSDAAPTIWVIELARAFSGSTAVIDDLAGRRCAESMGIRLRGTVGLVLAARQAGRLDAARPVLEWLRDGGMYLSDAVLLRTLRLVGE